MGKNNTKGLNIGIKVVKDERSNDERIKELVRVTNGLIKAFDIVVTYNINNLPISESGNPKFGTFGTFSSKYNEEGKLVKKKEMKK